MAGSCRCRVVACCQHRDGARSLGDERVQRIEGQLVLSPTDLTKHLACPHVTTLDLAALAGPGERGARTADDALNLVFSKGLDHERA